MKLSQEARRALEAVAHEKQAADGPNWFDVSGGVIKGTGDVAGAGIDLAKFELKTLISLLAGGAMVGGATAGLAASKLTEPSTDDIKKIQAELANAQVDRATAQLERSMRAQDSLEAAANKKAKKTRTLML
jgi:hypothetical protein